MVAGEKVHEVAVCRAHLASRGIHKSYLKIKNILINKQKFPRGRPVMGILRFEGSCRSFMKAEDANEKKDAHER
jgi:hypothetical protein